LPEPILKIIDVFFFAFHTFLVLFNVFGWFLPKWRMANFITLSLTAFSWFVLGIWFGWGYCLCTDWHWRVRDMLGYQDLSNSYIHFLILKVTSVDLQSNLVELYTVIVFILSFIISTTLNLSKWRRNRLSNKQ
jgi:hypothetical protein